jgi:hypothetical protein
VRFDNESIPLCNLDGLDVRSLLVNYREELERTSAPPDITNLLQELVGEINQLLYLLSLS